MGKRDPKNPRIVLQEDHRRIDALLDRLVACVRADDRDAEAESWTRVETALLQHLDVEEMFVFPALTHGHAKEVEALLREHAALRRELGAIGLALDLHTVRAETIETFCAMLRDHAEREDSLAYPQAEQRLPVNVVRVIVDRLARSTVARRRKPRAPASATRGPS
ncbi:MAG: hemerythrin domain-containing protein [Polyangiaceae bacterium]|jgi:hemerythrin-like domain-containing protein